MDMCVICQEPQTADIRSHDLPCGHRFHVKCLLEYFRRDGRCPVCRNAPEDYHSIIPDLQVFQQDPVDMETIQNQRDEIRHLKLELSTYRHIGWYIIKQWCYKHRSLADKFIYRQIKFCRSIQFHYEIKTNKISSSDEEDDGFTSDDEVL